MIARGFTLIELMIVLAIIGIIAAVVVPLFTKSDSTSYEPSRNSTSVQDVKCQNGLVLKNGDVVIENGNAVKC